MKYWTDNPLFKRVMPLANASFVKGLSTAFTTPQMFMGHNLLPPGRGAFPPPLAIIADTCEKKRAFVVTGTSSSKRFAKIVAGALEEKGFTQETWAEIHPEIPIDNIRACAEAMTKFEPDLIVAVGGGSPIDGAKAAWILYENPDLSDLFNLSPFIPFELRKRARLMAVPTTSGSGSEVTGASVISDPEEHRKIPLSNPKLMPDYVLLIPEFTKSMPPKLTVGTGLDALSHAWDCVCLPGSNEITDAMGLAAIEMIFQWLPRAYKDGDDIEARMKMLLASSMAGLAFGQAGIALTHSFGHTLGGLFEIHHGLSVGVFVPYATQFYGPISRKWLRICKTLEVKADSDGKSLANLMDKLKQLYDEVDAPWAIKDMGVTKEQLEGNMDKLVKFTLDDISTISSPRPITPEQCEKMFRYAYEGKNIDF